VIKGVFEIFIIKKSEGFVKFNVSGENSYNSFKDESGGHRFQRIPPTERNGRYQTSTITVAVFHKEELSSDEIQEKDITWFACRGSGNGGQNRNKRDTAVTIVHKPTGLQIRCETERSQYQNKNIALKRLSEKLKEIKYGNQQNKTDQNRKEQVGTGQRGDKIRTIRIRDNVVTNHINGRKILYTEYIKGNFKNLTI